MTTPFKSGQQGSFTFGNSATPLNFAADLNSIRIIPTTATETVPATYATDEEDHPGSTKWSMEIAYQRDPTVASSLYYELLNAQLADGYLDFVVIFQNDPVSTTNPRFTGRVVVTQVPIGQAPNEYWADSQTYPVVDLEIAYT